jgi:tetratricopeptide (TPR) repeat protein
MHASFNSRLNFIGRKAKAALLVWVSALPLFAPLSLAAGPPAETELLRDAQLHPNSFAAANRLGEFYAATGNYSAAIRYLGKAHAIQPDSYPNSYDLALAYLKAGNSAEARILVEQLLRAQDKPELHNLLAAILDAEGRYRDAIAEYERAARADPSESNVFDLANELVSRGAFKPAVQIFQYGSAKYPRSARLRIGLGVAQYSLGRYAEAVQALCQAVDINPSDTKALDFLGKMYDVSPAMAEDVTKRLAHFAALYPQNAKANFYYALSLRKRSLEAGRKAWPEAESFLKKSTVLDPSFAEAHYQLGLLYQDEGRTEEAIHEYETSVQLRNDLSAAHYRLALLYKRTGRSDLAKRQLAIVDDLKHEGSNRR